MVIVTLSIFLFFKISHSYNLRTNFNTTPHSSIRISKKSTAYLFKVSRSKKMLLCWLKTTSLSLYQHMLLQYVLVNQASLTPLSLHDGMHTLHSLVLVVVSLCSFYLHLSLLVLYKECYIPSETLLRYARLIQYCLNLGCIKLVLIHKERHMLLIDLLKLLLNEHLIGYY